MNGVGNATLSLEQIVDAIRSDPAEGGILHLLALTYEFDPEQLANFLFSRSLFASRRLWKPDYAEMARIRPVVFYDAAKSRDTSALPPLLELHPWQSRAFGCHHSKAYLVVTELAVHLVLGSFNLTYQGLARNREVLGHFCWRVGDGARSSDAGMLGDWVRFLAGCLGAHVHASTASALQAIASCLKTRLAELPLSPGLQGQTQTLVWSGYKDRERGLDRLQEVWTAWHPGKEPDTLFAVSPFFDQDAEQPLARSFKQAFPSLRRLVLVTEENSLSSLSKAHFSGFASRELYAIKREVGASERGRIAQEAWEEGTSLPDDAVLSRRLHAKVLVLATGSEGLVYAGSANFSCNAWLGRNQELGFALRTDDAEGTMKAALSGLYADTGRSRFAELPDLPVDLPASDADEENVASLAYPGFIDFVTLELDETGRDAYFLLHPLPDHAAGWRDILEREYSVFWGGRHVQDGFAVSFGFQGRSQRMKNGEWQERLLQGRSLAFFHRPSRTCFWVPYLYAGELVARRESLLSLSSLEWLALFCPAGSAARGIGPEVFAPGAGEDGKEQELPPEFGPDRNSNPVVAMQSWLKLFGACERMLEQRLAGIFEDGRSTVDRVGHLVAGFLRTLSRLVDCDREREASSGEAWAFKTGETLQLARRLARQCEGRQAERALLDAVSQDLCAKLAQLAPEAGSALARYLAFIACEAEAGQEDKS